MIKRKDKIIIAALEILEEKGVSGLTTKYLAEKQGISEPALYRQYRNKDEICLAMIQILSSYDDQIMNTITQNDIIGNEAIEFYAARYGELYQSYSELTSILYSMDLYFYHEKTKTLIRNILNKRNDFLTKTIEKSDLKYDISPEQMAIWINDLIFTEVYRWRLSDKAYDLKTVLIDRVKHMIEREAIHENTLS